MDGYAGRLLRVDLSGGKTWVESLDEARARRYLGGRGLGARILMDEVPEGCDPLGPENRLIFAMGPLAGTFAPGSGRYVIVAKSPATGVFGEAYTGGFVAHELKYAGYDGIVVQGNAPEKVYLAVANDRVEIRPASHLAGRGTLETEEKIKEEMGDLETRIVSIGLAGENRVCFACVMNDTDRAAGRTGMGAVMGAKNLKAIAIRGTGRVALADPKAFREHALADLAKIRKHPWLAVTNDRVEIRPASHLAGRGTLETEEKIKEETGDPETRIESVGLAGENAVRFACVMNDTDRAAGRTGMGAVMGAKNLKAIAIRGTGRVALADPKAFREHALADLAKIRKHPWLGDRPGSAGNLGTAGGVEDLSQLGILPTRNWETGAWEYADRISGTAMKNTILIGRRACQACPVGCTRVVRVADGPFGGVRPEYGGPEYETVAALGSLCQNRNLQAIALLNQKCNAYGLDTISAGSAIAFAMECFEKGLLTEKEIGFRLDWGDAAAMIRLLDLIARREGIGDLLADGTGRAAAKIGRGASEFAVEVKGLELGMHEARGKKGLALSYATAPRGADHMEGFHDPMIAAPNAWPELGVVQAMDRFTLEGKPRVVRLAEDYTSFINSLPICSFMSLTVAGVRNTEELSGMLAAATGWRDITIEEEMAIGERAYNLARAFTVRESGGKADDRLPVKLSRSLRGGASKGQVITDADLQAALQEYYRVRGWSENGTPTEAKLRELGLEDVAQQLATKGGGR